METKALVPVAPSGLDRDLALKLACRITSFYPNGGKNISKGYIASLVTVLLTYPSVAEKCADPVRGVARDTKFLPTPAELIAWCDKEMSDLHKASERIARANQHRIDREADDYWERVRLDRPTLQQMQDHYGPNWGITVQRTRRPYQSLTDSELRSLYPRHALDPE